MVLGDLDLDRAYIDPFYLTFVRAFLVSVDNSANGCPDQNPLQIQIHDAEEGVAQ
jgi:hypothetical protein